MSTKTVSAKSRYSLSIKKNNDIILILLLIISIIIPLLSLIRLINNIGGFNSMLDLIIEPGKAYYNNMNNKLESDITTQFLTLISPVIVYVLACSGGILKSRKLKLIIMLLMVLIINTVPFLIRGTNFGLFYYLLIVIISLNIFFNDNKSNKTKTILLSGGVILVLYFISTMSGRLGINYIPNTLSYIYVDKKSIFFDVFPPEIAVSIISATSYFSQGYYGLSLSFNYPFTSTEGFGGGYFIISKFESLFNNSLFERT